MVEGPARILCVALLSTLLAACAAGSTAPWSPAAGTPEPRVAQCMVLDQTVARAVETHGVQDTEAAPVPGLPFLRVDRLLASYRSGLASRDALAVWLDRAAELDRQGRAGELAVLPTAVRRALGDGIAVELAACRTMVVRAYADDPSLPDRLAATAAVPDRYSALARAVGLYPITGAGVGIGIWRWERAVLPRFDRPIGAAPPDGEWIAWDIGPSAVATETAPLPRDALGLPVFSDAVLDRLARAHAPIVVIDTATEDDRPGHPIWRRGPDGSFIPGVDRRRPVLFVRPAITRFGGRARPQLVYTVWFDARTPAGRFDPYAGPLDGLMWRVTLDDRGRPLLYDSIHACGCYHLFFPVPPVTRVPVPADADGEEAPLTPRSAPVLDPGQRMVLMVDAGTHYLHRIGTQVPEGAAPAQWPLALPVDGVPDAELRRLPVPGEPQRRSSLFRPDGLVAGSDRLERYYLWPMGIASAGAMRQWGHHATAFVGRRHFDDPFLFDAAFDLGSSDIH